MTIDGNGRGIGAGLVDQFNEDGTSSSFAKFMTGRNARLPAWQKGAGDVVLHTVKAMSCQFSAVACFGHKLPISFRAVCFLWFWSSRFSMGRGAGQFVMHQFTSHGRMRPRTDKDKVRAKATTSFSTALSFGSSIRITDRKNVFRLLS